MHHRGKAVSTWRMKHDQKIHQNIIKIKDCSDGGAEDILVESDEESDDETPPISLAQTRAGRVHVIKFNRQFTDCIA